MAKLRGKIPTLLSGSSGKPSIVEAKKMRECRRCKCSIKLREKLFEIPKTGGFAGKKSFCMSCFREILDQTQKDLGALELTWSSNLKD